MNEVVLYKVQYSIILFLSMKKTNVTLFIATIALVAPFIPEEIEVLAYRA